MNEEHSKRELSGILSADAVDYSRLMEGRGSHYHCVTFESG